tara:strand:- start:603 stop:1196 length:594 start_codon:yes stop_codon:yes gene_type:complete
MSDPYIEKYKSALKELGVAIKYAHKTEEGKKLSTEYWTHIVKLLKKAKLGVSMMELGIDDEEEIENTLDTTIKKVKPTPDGEKGEGGPRDDTETSGSDLDEHNDSLTNKRFYDIMNHLGILLSEQFDDVSKDGTEFVVDTNDRKFTIKFDDKFFMVSEDYNFELGDDSDIQNVVQTFAKLSSVSHEDLVKEYSTQVV